MARALAAARGRLVLARFVYDVAMKLYTKRGDDGQTDLIGGRRVPKNHLRVEAYGCVDELNAAVGLCLACCEMDAIRAPLITAQRHLFDIGAQLATPGSENSDPSRIKPEHIAEVEQQIDHSSDALPPLRSFILPGGTELSARLHLARTVCRRAERAVVTLATNEPVDASAGVYLNRLADLLFTLARQANASAGVEDVPWTPEA